MDKNNYEVDRFARYSCNKIYYVSFIQENISNDNDILSPQIEGKIENRHGITFAESFADAMEKIEHYYGNELNTVAVTLLEECSIYEFESTKSDFSHGVYRIDAFSKW